MTKNKKPTMMQVKNVINNMLADLSGMQKALEKLDFILNYYIKYNKNEEKFSEWLKKEVKKLQEKEAKNGSNEKSANESK